MSSGISTVTCMGIICCAASRHIGGQCLNHSTPRPPWANTTPRATQVGNCFACAGTIPESQNPFSERQQSLAVQLPTARNLPLCVNYSPAVRLFHAGRGRVPAGQFYVNLHEAEHRRLCLA